MFRFAKQDAGGPRGAAWPHVRQARAALANAALLTAALAMVSSGCTEEVRLGRVLGSVDSGFPPAVPAAGAPGSGGQPLFPLGGSGGQGGAAGAQPPALDAGPCVPVTCGGNTPYACGNCLDDDTDGFADASDPECLGPCDDSERELYSGTETSVTGSCRIDCYFDRNAGSGDDGCSWSYSCDPGSVGPEYPPTGSPMCLHDPALAACNPDSVELTACRAGCLPLTPNGCDCFGCCELPAGSGSFVWLGSPQIAQAHCEIGSSTDRDACRPCTPAPSCHNTCEECELCVGKSALPAQCSGAAACPEGVRSCDPQSGAGCSPLEYCITGCCVRLPA
jgi:hypothetical protein